MISIFFIHFHHSLLFSFLPVVRLAVMYVAHVSVIKINKKFGLSSSWPIWLTIWRFIPLWSYVQKKSKYYFLFSIFYFFSIIVDMRLEVNMMRQLWTLSFPRTLFLSLALSHKHTNAHSLTPSHTHKQSLSHAYTYSLTLSLAHSPSLSLSLSLCLSLSLSDSQSTEITENHYNSLREW